MWRGKVFKMHSQLVAWEKEFLENGSLAMAKAFDPLIRQMNMMQGGNSKPGGSTDRGLSIQELEDINNTHSKRRGPLQIFQKGR